MPAEQLHRRLSAGDIDVLALSCTMPPNLIPGPPPALAGRSSEISTDVLLLDAVDDAIIVADLRTWLCGLLRRTVPASVITTSAQLLAETLEPQFASGAAILRDAADKVEMDMTGSGDDDER